VRKIVAEIDPDVPVDRATSFDDFLEGRFWARRLSASLATLFSGVAILLSAAGLYGVLAYSVLQRRRELGVRIALGAQSSTVLALVLRRGLLLSGIGLAVGIATTLILGPFIGSLLYGIPSTDPITLVVAVLVLSLAVTFACLLPALRAVRINPVRALRE
jgi:ABC-type antimicrobial peptide transport system permease subunit